MTDTGIGIPAADLPYVFDKFYRVKSKATRDIEGTGLGLAITRSVVESHGGRIWVESEEGQGQHVHLHAPHSVDEGRGGELRRVASALVGAGAADYNPAS